MAVWNTNICQVRCTTIPTTSTVGAAVSVNFLFMPREVDTLTFIVNDDSSKCAEQRTDEREGVKCGRCFQTNRTHFFLLSGAFSSSGSVCINIPSAVCWLFVQLAWLGPPATQYLPPRGCGALLDLVVMLKWGQILIFQTDIKSVLLHQISFWFQNTNRESL